MKGLARQHKSVPFGSAVSEEPTRIRVNGPEGGLPQSTIRAQRHKGQNPPAGRHRGNEIVPAEAGRLTDLAAITAFGQPVSFAAALTTCFETAAYDGIAAPRWAS